MIVFAEDVCMVRAALRYVRFYAHESCGKCTPCREGTFWTENVLRRIEAGQGTETDLDTILSVQNNIFGRSFCALGDFAVAAPNSTIALFRDEYLRHVTEGKCPFER